LILLQLALGPGFHTLLKRVLCHSTQQQCNQHERHDKASAESQQAHRCALDHVHAKPIENLVDVEEVDTTVPNLHQGAPLHSVSRFAWQGGAKQHNANIACTPAWDACKHSSKAWSSTAVCASSKKVRRNHLVVLLAAGERQYAWL